MHDKIYAEHINNGLQGEVAAADFIQNKGLTILEKNFRMKRGEIDLIAKEGSSIVFIEVRFRQPHAMVSAAESITLQKQKNIIRTALYYLQKNKLVDRCPCRFDVITVEPQQEQFVCTWIENAFNT